MYASIPSAVVLGVDGRPVSVEVHVGRGLPGLTIVGLPDASCREARDRVRAAVLASELPWPDRKITVNLAPSSTRKVGSGLDLAIAVGVLAASGEVPSAAVADLGFLGELGLDGTVRAVAGTVPLVDAVGAPQVVVPVASAADAALVDGRTIRAVRTLSELVAALRADAPWPDHDLPRPDADDSPPPDLADVRGQPVVRAALEVAAAGGHHLLMVGPPGAGKTMLAERLPGLLPPLARDEAMAVSRIHSAAGRKLAGGLIRRPPFRAPHHTATLTSLVGGGSDAMRPGEVSLASGGVLFLDELSEFAPSSLDALRQPLEDGTIRVRRARFAADLPARFLLVAAMNPCPCGEAGRPGACRCPDGALARYQRRLSGPLLDRFDLRVDVHRPIVDDLLGGEPGEPSAAVAGRVRVARDRARDRGVRCNAELRGAALDRFASIDPSAEPLLRSALETGRLTARGLDRVRRVARTLADLAGDDESLGVAHLSAALQLRAEVRLGAGVVA
ncbi:MAG: YifB family Mg chelatase-like AAA ATPase [Acidimicrobiales bacterium]